MIFRRPLTKRCLVSVAALITLSLPLAVPGGADARDARPAVDASRVAAIDRAFADAYAKDAHGGLTVGLVADGRLVWTQSYGFADRALDRRANRKTVYRIGSITKQFTAIAYLQLLAAGKLRGDQSVADVYPPLRAVRGPKEQIAAISFDALATHRSGLAREPDDMRFLAGPIEQWEKTLAEALTHTAIAFPQFAKPEYSNIGYGTLGAAMGTVAGMPYIDLVERRLIAPLGMRNTGFKLSPAMRANLARGYTIEPEGESAAMADTELQTGRGYKIPNGGLFTTVDDLARFVAFEMDGAPGVLSRQRLEENRRTLYPAGGGQSFGRGFMQQTSDYIGHGGAVAGFTAGAYFDPERRVGIVCLRNAMDRLCSSDLLRRALRFISVPGATLDAAPQ